MFIPLESMIVVRCLEEEFQKWCLKGQLVRRCRSCNFPPGEVYIAFVSSLLYREHLFESSKGRGINDRHNASAFRI
jgi:hypothetical protein